MNTSQQHLQSRHVDDRFLTQWERSSRDSLLTVLGDTRSADAWVSELRALSKNAPADEDRYLAGLLEQVRDGSELAAHVILFMLRPKLLSLATYGTTMQRLGFRDLADRMGHVYAAAWLELRSAVCTTSVKANLVMNISKAVLRCPVTPELAVDPIDLVDVEAETDARDPEEALTRLLTWASASGLLTREEIILIARAYFSGLSVRELAAESEVEYEAFRKRLLRAKKRLIESVQQRYKLLGL